jgi:hypothetical protein
MAFSGDHVMEICRKCSHYKDAHKVSWSGYECVHCKCKRRFWR